MEIRRGESRYDRMTVCVSCMEPDETLSTEEARQAAAKLNCLADEIEAEKRLECFICKKSKPNVHRFSMCMNSFDYQICDDCLSELFSKPESIKRLDDLAAMARLERIIRHEKVEIFKSSETGKIIVIISENLEFHKMTEGKTLAEAILALPSEPSSSGRS